MKINNQQIIAISKVNEDDEPYFSYEGCENCGNGLGNDVEDYKAVTSFQHSKDDYYEIKLCAMCLCAYHNGDPLDEDCRNLLFI